MSERLTDEQLRETAENARGDGARAMAAELLALRARVAELEDRCKGYSMSVEANCREIERLEARVAKLEEVHRELAQICWEGGSLDGGELQDMLVKHGVLVETIVEKPCSGWCNCEDNDAVFPTTCYRLKDAPQ